MGEAKDLTQEAPQAGSGPDGFLVNEGIELSTVIHILWSTEGTLGRTMWNLFGIAKHPIEVKEKLKQEAMENERLKHNSMPFILLLIKDKSS